MPESTAQFSADSEARAARSLFRGVTRTWPNDCPDCGTLMEFAFTPQTTRQCPKCGHAIRVNPMTGDFQQLRAA